MFPTDIKSILSEITKIDPIQYGKSRNFIDGSVTKLSPYVSRGIISTRFIANNVLSRGHSISEIEGFLRQLAWRDYFQRIWMNMGKSINSDLKHQQDFLFHGIPESIYKGQTKISAIDTAVNQLKLNGYIHNHSRLYLASIACNVGRYHWLEPAKWMYYYLLDADWGSNALSWQWVAGTNSSKKYFANQENINKYSGTNDNQTFLDIPYEEFELITIPPVLSSSVPFNKSTILNRGTEIYLNESLPVYVYNFYNLDCFWASEIEANRILLLEPSFFEEYPVSQNTIQFIVELSRNIKDIQIATGEFDDVFNGISPQKIHFKEHPTNAHYRGIQHERDWMFPSILGNYSSFFKYWKECKNNIYEIINE